MLTMTGVKLVPILYIDVYQFVEKGMSDSISYISQRFSKANKKCMIIYEACNVRRY